MDLRLTFLMDFKKSPVPDCVQDRHGFAVSRHENFRQQCAGFVTSFSIASPRGRDEVKMSHYEQDSYFYSHINIECLLRSSLLRGSSLTD